MLSDGERQRKNAITHSQSHSPDRSSLYSGFGLKKSKTSRSPSAGSEGAGYRQRRENKWLKPREYMLLLIEASVSVASKVINERVTQRGSESPKLTMHQKGIYGLYVQGYSSLVSIFIGCLTDSYSSYYAMALFSVAIHFVAISIHSMEDILRDHPKGNQYAVYVQNICVVGILLIKSTDFTRLVYGLEGMARRRKSTVHLYIFLHFWVSSYSTHGGIIATFFSAIWEPLENDSHAFRFPIASFVLTGLSLFFFVYILQPEASAKEQRGLGCRVIGCLLSAIGYKISRIHRRERRGFFANTEKTYEKHTISRTKDILVLYALLLPTLGIALSSMLNTGLYYEQLIWRLKTVKSIEKVGTYRVARIILAISMLFSYFGLWPLLTFMGVKNSLTVKFLFGHLLIVFSMFSVAVFFKTVEHLPYSTSVGLVRIFNTREESIRLFPEGQDVASHSLLVGSKKGITASYPCRIRLLFPMKIVFRGTKTNYTFFLNVYPGEVTGYVVLDPPEIGRIRGPFLPLREGPPGTNIQGWPRIFIYNTAATLRNASVKIELTQDGQWKTIRVLKSRAGIMTTIALKPGTYKFGLSQARITKTVEIQEGTFYGVIIHTSTSRTELDIDEVVPPSTASPWPFICRYIVEGLAAGIGYPALRAMIYNLAPPGLLAMSFAFLAFLEGISFWVQFIGFKTWHYFVTANAIFAYALLVASFFVLCMFVLFKYMRRDS